MASDEIDKDSRLHANVRDAVQAVYDSKWEDSLVDLAGSHSSLHAGTHSLPTLSAHIDAAASISACYDRCHDLACLIRSMAAAKVNALSPVHRLPADVVIEILRLLGYRSRVRASQSFALWREIALGEPTLWNVIRLRREGHVRRLHELAARSKGAPLHVTLKRNFGGLEAARELLAMYASRLATFHCTLPHGVDPEHRFDQQDDSAQPVEEFHIPPCELLTDFKISSEGRKLYVHLDNAHLPRLETLTLWGATNITEVLENISTPSSISFSLQRADEDGRFSLCALQSLINRCLGLRDLAMYGVGDDSMAFDALHSLTQPAVLLDSLYLVSSRLPRENLLRLMDCARAKSVMIQGESHGIAGLLHGMGPAAAEVLAAMFLDLQGPVSVTIVPAIVHKSTRRTAIRRPQAFEDMAGVVLVASDDRGFRREISGVSDPRTVLEASKVSIRVRRLECSVKIWFNRLATAPSLMNPSPTRLPFPQLSHLILHYDDDPNLAEPIRLPHSPMLRSLVLYDQKTPPRALRADEVDNFVASIAGTESVHLESAEFVGPVLAGTTAGAASFARASRVEFKTAANVVKQPEFRTQVFTYDALPDSDNEDA